MQRDWRLQCLLWDDFRKQSPWLLGVLDLLKFLPLRTHKEKRAVRVAFLSFPTISSLPALSQLSWRFSGVSVLRVNWGESVCIHVTCATCVFTCCLCSYVDCTCVAHVHLHGPCAYVPSITAMEQTTHFLFYFGDIQGPQEWLLSPLPTWNQF